MKKVNSYYFSVEGENEKWYCEHLQKLINNSEESVFNVQFIIKIDKSPLRLVGVLVQYIKNDKNTAPSTAIYVSADKVLDMIKTA